MFIERTRTALGELMSRRLDDVRLAVMMLDGLRDRRSHARRRARDHDRGREDPARAVGGLDRERHARADSAGRPCRPRPRSRAGDPVRHRRREGAAPGDQRRVRRARAGASLSSPQGAQCLRPAARTRPPRRPAPGSAARGRSTTPSSPSSGWQLLASSSSSTWPDAAGSLREGIDRDADADAARDHRPALQDAVLDEPV